MAEPVITYDFNGTKHIRTGHNVRTIAGEESEVFEQLCDLERQAQWHQLRDLCEIQITKTPEWITPYLCAGVALANLGEEKAAIRRLEHVERAAAGDSNYAAATRVLRELRRQ
jgi:hypothetical protein